MNDDADSDDLLQPTVAPAEPKRRPWRLASQFWVAFFGGVVAVTIVAWENARRLDVPPSRRRWILVAGLVAAAAVFGAFWWIHTQQQPTARPQSYQRASSRIIAVLLFLVLRWIQAPADSRYTIFGRGEHQSLWTMGVVASLIGILATGLIWFAVTRLVQP